MSYLPNEIWGMVFENLEPADVGNVRRTSKHFAALGVAYLYRELCVYFSTNSIRNFLDVARDPQKAPLVKRIVLEDVMLKVDFDGANRIWLLKNHPEVTFTGTIEFDYHWRHFAHVENFHDWTWTIPYFMYAMQAFVNVEAVEFHHGFKNRRPVRPITIPHLMEGSWWTPEYQGKMWHYRATYDIYEPTAAPRSNHVNFASRMNVLRAISKPW